MEEDRNIRLTIVQPKEEASEEELTINISLFFSLLRRFFTLWLVLAVAVAAVFGGAGLLLRDILSEDTASAVLRVPLGGTDGEQTALKVKSAVVVEQALNALGLSTTDSDVVRDHLTVKGIIPKRAVDQISLYYDTYEKSTTIETVDAILNTDLRTDLYLVSFDYHGAKLARQDGVNLLNFIINAYQEYLLSTYASRPLLGNADQIIDYQDYDYAEAVNFFSSRLNDIKSYLAANRGSGAGTFHSSVTGFSLSDLEKTADSLSDIELSRLTSFVTVNSVCKGSVEDVIAHYEWIMVQNRERISVLEARRTALMDAIANYEKDPLLYAVSESGLLLSNDSGSQTDAYDSLISQAQTVENEITELIRQNEYYSAIVEGFRVREAAVPEEDIQRVEQDMAKLSQKIRSLVETVNATMDEYFDLKYADIFSVIVPAQASAPPILLPVVGKAVVVMEVLLLLVYMGGAFFLSMKEEMSRRAREKEGRKRESL